MNTTIKLRIHDTNVLATVEIPVPELGRALETDLSAVTQKNLPSYSNQIDTYLLRYFKPHSGPAKLWAVAIENKRITEGKSPTGDSYAKLLLEVVLTPPAGETVRKFDLGYSAVIERVFDHIVIVTLTQDWASGAAPARPLNIGTLRYDVSIERPQTMIIDLSQKTMLTGYLSMVKLGMEHIRDGTDHLLFLLTLLIPAPLIAAGRRWKGFAGFKATLHNILAITAAFTAGHSITLIIATLLSLRLPQQPIEVLIAASIVISAAHGLKPIFPGKEVLIAGFFGLIHGAAFSFILAELDLGSTQLFVSLLGFNVGIELMQLFIIGLVMPPLILLAQYTAYAYVRVIGALLSIGAGVGWLLSRLGISNPVGNFADSLGDYAPVLLAALLFVSVVIFMRTFYDVEPRDNISDTKNHLK